MPVVKDNAPLARDAVRIDDKAKLERIDSARILGRIDEIVFAHLAKAGLAPAPPASDEIFLRRVFLDVIGTLPTVEEVKTFLKSKDPNRRSLLIDQLLERNEFALYRAMKWSDLLCIKAEFPINLWPVAAREYYRWLLESLTANKPYDQFARELLTASGSNFRYGPANFFRAVQNRDPQALAQVAARVFMGVRTENWPAPKRASLAVFFSQLGYKPTGEWKEEIVFYDQAKRLPATNAILPDGSKAALAAGADPRQAFAGWLIDAKNPYFARNLVNRIWVWLYGRGVIEEPDDIRPNNTPLYPDLLSYLEKELTHSGFNQKHIYRSKCVDPCDVHQDRGDQHAEGDHARLEFAAASLDARPKCSGKRHGMAAAATGDRCSRRWSLAADSPAVMSLALRIRAASR